MQDQPTPFEIMGAVAEFLRSVVAAEASPRTAFVARVAANALAILEREARLGPAADAREHARLVKLLGREGSLADLHRALARQLREGTRDEHDAALMEHLEATVADKIAIANPKWR